MGKKFIISIYTLGTSDIFFAPKKEGAERKYPKSLLTLKRSSYCSFFRSIASVAELHALALKHRWGTKRWQTLLAILQTIIVVPIDSQDLIDRYAEIDAFSQDKLEGKPLGMTARNMAKNDLWIAATASLLKLPLITNDADFNHLHNHFLQIYSIHT